MQAEELPEPVCLQRVGLGGCPSPPPPLQQLIGTSQPLWNQASGWCMASPLCLHSIERPLPLPVNSPLHALELIVTFYFCWWTKIEAGAHFHRVALRISRLYDLTFMQRVEVNGRDNYYSLHVHFYRFHCLQNVDSVAVLSQGSHLEGNANGKD